MKFSTQFPELNALQIKQLYRLITEVIGEDEAQTPYIRNHSLPEHSRVTLTHQYRKSRHELRAEQRQRLNKLFNREAILDAVEKVYDETHNLGQATDQILALFQAHQQELLSELLGELPPVLEQPKIYLREHTKTQRAATKAHIEGFNNCRNQVVSVIQSKIGELNG